MCKEWSVQPSYYLYGKELSLQDQIDIDLVVMAIGKQYEAEKQEKES